MKLVWDKPTKSFRLLGFLSLSFPFSLSHSLLLLLLLYSLSFSIFLFTSIRTFLLDPFPPPSLFLFVHLYFSANFFLFFFANSNRGEEKRERKKGEEWHILSSTGSLRFPYPILPSRKMKLLLSPLFLPNLPPLRFTLPAFPLGSFQAPFQGKASSFDRYPFFPSSSSFFLFSFLPHSGP